MSQVFVIPDVHLKPWIFEQADKFITEEQPEYIVFLGDLVDDWGQEKNIDLYNETFDKAEEFINKYRDKIKWCYGNHDVSYLWNRLESGFSYHAQETVVRRMKSLQDMLENDIAFVHRIGNTLFSHAGLTEEFVKDNCSQRASLNSIIKDINYMSPKILWQDSSPLWARPQYQEWSMYPRKMFQVVGHTPVKRTERKDNFLSTDTFSTWSNGSAFGNGKFVIVDKESFEYREL